MPVDLLNLSPGKSMAGGGGTPNDKGSMEGFNHINIHGSVFPIKPVTDEQVYWPAAV